MSNAQEILDLNHRLLEAIAAADWKTYEELCDPELTCFEPEARGHLVQGLAFHRFYFDLGASPAARNTTVASPVVRFCGDDVAIVAYIRLTQKVGDDGKPITIGTEETRIWHRQGNRWRHVHFHRSALG
jgi:calcium/calmodulin-dependent protein kinase (CaM kinase) II